MDFQLTPEQQRLHNDAASWRQISRPARRRMTAMPVTPIENYDRLRERRTESGY